MKINENVNLSDPNLGKMCINQIYYLKSKNHVKIRDIELEAGVRVGYLSRYRKMENPPLPAAEVILATAKLCHTSLEGVIFKQDYLLTPTEEKIAEFIDDLADDTFGQELKWKEETEEDLKDLNDSLPFSDGADIHPLYRHREIVLPSTKLENGCEEWLRKTETVYGYFGYNSAASTMPDELLGPLYHAALPASQAVIYLAHIKHTNGENPEDEYELSFVQKDTLIGAIGSLTVCDTIAGLLRDLYGAVEDYFARFMLDSQVNSIISAFIGQHDQEESSKSST